MFHFRDARPGNFYLNDHDAEPLPSVPSDQPAFLRFARARGAGSDDLGTQSGLPVPEVLSRARLDWPVMSLPVIVPAGEGLKSEAVAVGYKALVRPDTEQIMSVVNRAYGVADNDWVAEATEHLAQRGDQSPRLVAAVAFGRTGERTLFGARVAGDHQGTVCLLAHNSHGGEGAVRFQLVEVAASRGVTYVLDSRFASQSLPHIGDVNERLRRLCQSGGGTADGFVDCYLAETQPLWTRLGETPWTPHRTRALVQELWGETPDTAVGSPELPVRGTDQIKARHPGHHLPGHMQDCSDAATAYRALCDWLDNSSEACERGDFTKDRDERLALGAGNKYKRDAWRWIISNSR